MKSAIVVSNHVHNLPPLAPGAVPAHFSPSREMWKVRVLVNGTAVIPNPPEDEEPVSYVPCPHYVDFVPKGRGHGYFDSESEAREVAGRL